MVLIVPLSFVCVATQTAPGNAVAAAIGRLSLTAAALMCTVYLAMALRFGGPLALGDLETHTPSGRLRKTRYRLDSGHLAPAVDAGRSGGRGLLLHGAASE